MLGLLYGSVTGMHVWSGAEDEDGLDVVDEGGFVIGKDYTGAHTRNYILGVGCSVVIPLLLASDVAHVSSLCDTLVNQLHELRLQWPSTEEAKEVHARGFPLQGTLERVNNKQGLGFTVFGKVVDKRTLNVILISAISFFSTVVPIVITLMPNPQQNEIVDFTNVSVADALQRVFDEIQRTH